MSCTSEMGSTSEVGLGSAVQRLGRKWVLEKMSGFNYAASMEGEAAALRAAVPDALCAQLFAHDGAPKDLHALALRSLILLALMHRELKARFTEAEKKHLATLNDDLMRLYCAQRGVTLAPNDKAALNDSLPDALVGVGISREEVESAVAEASSESAEALWTDLRNDALFHKAFLKHARRSMTSETGELSESLAEAKKDIEECVAKNAESKDSFFALRSSLGSALEALTLCELSGAAMEAPKTLPCLHSFSAAALKARLDPGDKTVTCPRCRTRVAAADVAAIDALPASFVLVTLVALSKRLKTEKAEELECTLCIQAATLVSLHSGLLYCREHNATLYRRDDELMATASDLLVKGKVEEFLLHFCAQHKLPLLQYCSSCQVPLCGSNACVSWHSQHGQLTPLDTVRLQHRATLTHLDALVKMKVEKLGGRVASAEANQVAVADLQENIRQSINSYFEDLQAQMGERKAEFFRDLDKAANECWTADETAITALKRWAEEADKKLEAMSHFPADPEPGAKTNGISAAASSPVQITAMAALNNDLMSLLSDTAEGNSLSESKSISYPEAQLRTVLQSFTSLKSRICAVASGRGWELLLRSSGLRSFLVQRHTLFVVRKNMLAGSAVYSYNLKDLNAAPCIFCESGTHEFQGLAVADNGDLLIPEEVQSSLEIPSLRVRKSVSINQYSPNRERRSPPMCVEALNTFGKVLLRTQPAKGAGGVSKTYLGDDQCIVELDSAGQVARKFDFYTMVTIADFCPEASRDLLLVTDAAKHQLLVFNCKAQQMLTVGKEGATPAAFSHPSGVAVDPYGHVFVADSGNSRVQVFDLQGRFLKLLAYPQSLRSPPSSTIHPSGMVKRLRDVTTAPKAAAGGSVLLQAADDYLYLWDNRSDAIYRLKYI